MSQYELCYRCKGCGHCTPTYITDNKVAPPPDLCDGCCRIQITSGAGTLAHGDIFNGLQLVEYSKRDKLWAVLCLWCKNTTTVRSSNVRKQQSCGCLKKNSLKAQFYHDLKNDGLALVRAQCRICELEADYNLLDKEPLTCQVGCQSDDDEDYY